MEAQLISKSRQGSRAYANTKSRKAKTQGEDFNPLNIIPNPIQAKLTVNRPGDAYEQEADRVADQVMSMSSNIQTKPLSISRKEENNMQRNAIGGELEEKKKELQMKPLGGVEEEKEKELQMKPMGGVEEKEKELQMKPISGVEEEKEKLQRKELKGGEAIPGYDLESYVGNLGGRGQSLPDEVRGFYEPRFGYDFSNVKVHTDAVAAKSAQSINALAYTSGNNIVFNQNQFDPESANGKKLLAHELTHVLQQNSNVDSTIKDRNSSASVKLQTKESKVQRDTLRESKSGDWAAALVELLSIYEGAGGIIGRQKDAVSDFSDSVQVDDPPSVVDSIVVGAISMALGAALGGVGFALKAAAVKYITPALVGSVDAIITKLVDAGKTRVASAVITAWSGGGASAPTPALQFKVTQMQALGTIARAQVQSMTTELGRLHATSDLNDEWDVANSLYAAFTDSLSIAYNEQYNKMTDNWFSMQISMGIGRGARPGVLQIYLSDSYPTDPISISSGNLLGEGNNSSIRRRIGQRPLESIDMPKVIQMNGSMGYGVLDCIWDFEVTGDPQSITSIHGNRWGMPWLAARHVWTNDLDSDDPRYNYSNVHAGANSVWDKIKNRTPRFVDDSTW